MASRRLLMTGTAAFLLALVLGPATAGEEEDKADEALCLGAKVATNGPALLAFFRARTLTDAKRERLAGLVEQLGNDEFKLRQQASTALADFTHAWNGYGYAPDWAALHAQLPAITSGMDRWQRQLQHLGDLAANLVAFCENRVK